MTDAAPPEKPRYPNRFKPGQSGNPKGKPTGARSKRALALDALAEGEVEAIVLAMCERAKEGDVTAAGQILSRVWAPRKGRPVNVELPPVRSAEDASKALGAIVAAVSSGELTPDEGQTVAGVISEQRKTLELVDMEKRLAALEATVKTGAGDAGSN